MDGQVVQIMNTNEVEGLADPSLQQYECSLYTEKDERDVIQKKTFTKWVNKHLIKSWRFAKAYLCSHGCCSFEPDNCCCFKDHKGVEDLFEDLRDGHNLLTLLEVLSGEHLSREKGYMRVHMLQNVQIALNFLKNQRIKLVNIRPEDIVDGNPKLTLGLIWTIILHYQISDIIQHEENELPKEILLKWAQMTTEAYPNVYIKDFTNSWKDGLAFLAILHRNKPDLINFTEKINKPIRENLELAFNIYEKNFNICRLLDPEDVDTCKPDEKSLITYISSIYELFKEPPEFNPFKDVDYTKKINNYTVQASSLINWIKDKTVKLNDLSWRGKANIILHQLYDDLQDFHDKELPICLKENQKLKDLYKSLSKMNLQNEIPESLNQSEIEYLINKMMNAFNLRQNAIKEDLKRAQIIAEKIVDESEICHLNLEEIKSSIIEQSERIERLNEEDNIKNFEYIKKNLDDEEKRLEFMIRNLEVLDQLSYHHYDELDKKVKQLKNLHENLLNQFDLKLISQFEFKKQQLKKQEELEKEHQKLLKKQQLLQQQFEEQQKQKPLTEEELISSNAAFKAIAEYIKNYENKLAELNDDYFVFAANTFNLNKQFEKLLKDKEKVNENFNQFIIDSNSTKSQISKLDLTIYDNLVLKLEKIYNDLCESLDLKEKQLKELIDFLEPAENELKWLNNHEENEINRDWSSIKQLDLKQLDKHHRQLIATMNDREDQFTEILDKGENLIKQNHEATEIIQNQMNKLQLQWSWLLQLTNCLETHMKNVDFSQKFYQQLDECNEKFDLIENSLKNIDCKQSENSIEQGEKLLTEIHKIKDDIHQHAQSIKDVALKCKKVVPYKARRQPLTKPIKVTSACMIKQINSTIEQDEQCVLIDNSTKAKWTVKTKDSKEITAPGCCFVFCPPDKQAIESTEILKKRCENLSNIWASKEHRLRKNMIIATLNVVKSWDFNTYNKMDSEQRSVILLALENDIEKLSQNEPKNIINDDSDELDGESLKSSNGNDSKSLSEQMSLLKTRFKEFDLKIENELNDKNKQNENLEKYNELNDQIVVELTEKKNILLQRAQDAVPRDPEQFDQLVLDHKLFQNEYDQLNERVEEINIIFNQMDKKPFEVQSKHNSLTMLFSHTGDLIDLYTQRLHEIGNILSSYDECLDAISALEIKIAILDDMPADENTLNHLLENSLKEIEKKLKHSHSQFDNLQLYLNNLKHIIDKTRSKQSSNVDLLRLEEDIKSLNIRWETLNNNLIKFKSAIEHYSSLLINYRTKMDHERVWLSQMTSQVTSSIVNNDIEAINLNYDDLLKRESQIQDLNVLSMCLIRDAQSFNKRLKEYKEDLEDVHPSLDANLNSKSPQTITGSEQIANDFESLQTEYNNLCDTIVNYLNDLEEEHRRITEEAAELEELQMEIAIKEMTDLCDNLQKIADWLNTMEKVYEQPIQCSRIMETLKSQIEEEKNILNEIENQKININHIQEKANELNSFSQEDDYQILPDNIINVIIPDAITSLENLNEKVLERIEKLQLSVKESQEFNKSLNVLRAWLEQQKIDQQLNETINISNDSTKLKEMLLKHKEFQRKLNAKQAIYDVVMKIGRSLKDKSSKDEVEVIQEMLNDLKNEWTDVCNKSIDRQRKLEEALLVAGQFKDALQALFDWIDKAKDNLTDDCVFGDRETVVHLIEAHHLFQEDLKNHAKNLNQVRKFCNELCQAAEGNYQQIGNIPDQLDELENKWEELNKLSDSKEFQLQDALEHSEKLQKSITELFNWLNEVDDKLRLLDQLPDDVEILKQQINEHVKFMNKLNEQETIKQKSISLAKETLVKCHPDAVSVINHWISTIETLWLDVTNHSKQRETKLKEHSEKLKDMFKLLDELHAWIVTSETDLIVADSEFMPDEIDILEKLIESHNEFIDQMSSKQKDIEKIARTFSTKKANISSNQNNSATQISDFKRKAGGASFTAQFHTNSSSNHYSTLASLKQEEIRNPKAKDVIEKWRSVWLLSIEHKRRLKDQLEHCKEMEKMKTFEFDEWRSRFLNWLKIKKARVLDFFKQMDTDNDGKLTREQFIEGFLKSKFTTSRMELEYVTPIFDRNNDGMIGQKEYLDTLRPDRDILKTDNEIIQNEVHAQVAKCTCPHKYKVFQVEEGKYSFGESQKLCLVRILRSTVMVRVGGGWASLDEFLVKHDPCRARGRTNVELREQFILANGVSQSMTPFITKLHSSANSHAGSIKGSLNDLLPQFPTTGPITKIREKTERSVPMCFNKYYSRSKSNSSVNGFQNGNSTNGHTKNNGHVITCSEHSKNGKLKTTDLNSDGSFTETDSGTKSRPRSRMTLNSTGSRTPNSRPASRSASRPPSRVGSDMSTESLETYKHLNKTNKIQHSTPSNKRYIVTPSGIKRTLSYGSASSAKERWK